ncbi:hypothetical protein OROMI_007099 [Orobanche minor]
MDIARGMNYLHENKPEAIIHHDLEPYRDDFGHLNVADFGVSKLLKVANRVKEDRPLTCHDTSCRYVAPEVFRNEDEATVEGDIKQAVYTIKGYKPGCFCAQARV